ncbi:MAG: SufD family Fe-S cluster assembly protein [Candidatus Sulcia muelleri]|uniref:Putative FeS assembly protein SufD n=1 Tax=Karelsulcia muelleri (strain GWSS) TaxID=444179 RepID=A8Z645_KARMG|nr:putative FeS assembly protein SufD [Candidatus Karelsulcia muelleri GWSS]MBS0018913.1 SufD family Fe-S cluster assembly protein [Candidatus Karelsulcia muelleri]MCJ7422485.1 SufD family Fe-S cluster assembly protein [Candidatus Karelsulcia muelleri]MCJ7468653.1 SufD family Fe-S cluster assembly protein [Candidatus Karelsulcia muelleri]
MNFKKRIYYNSRIEINNYINYYINIIRNKSIKLLKKNFSLKYEKIKSSIIDYEYLFPVKEAEYIYYDIINQYILDKNGMYLFFINGFYVFNFFKKNKKYLLSINDIIINNKNYCNSNIEKFYGKSISNNDTLNLFNFLFSKDGAYIFIPDNICFKPNIYIIYIYNINYDYSIINPRNLIIIGNNSKAQIVEIHESLTNKICFSNSVTEIYTRKNSSIDYIKIHNNLSFFYLRDKTFLTQKKNSTCSISTFSFEGRLLINNIKLINLGNYSNFNLNGLTIIKKKSLNKLIYNKTLIDHLYPTCESYQTYKSILYGRSKVFFWGKIKIHKKANNINALQKANNILINKNAFFYTKPELEISTDNVKCSHGCTIGQIDKNKIFYLRSRGVIKTVAKSILIFLFSKEILKKINIQNIKYLIKKIIINNLDNNYINLM